MNTILENNILPIFFLTLVLANIIGLIIMFFILLIGWRLQGLIMEVLKSYIPTNETHKANDNTSYEVQDSASLARTNAEVFQTDEKNRLFFHRDSDTSGNKIDNVTINTDEVHIDESGPTNIQTETISVERDTP